MRLTLSYPPTANNLKAIVRGRMVKTAEARRYFQRVALEARTQGARPLAGPLCVSVTAYRPRRAGDLDNVLKASLDALKGIAWEDDSQIVELQALRLDDRANPRLVVTVEELPVSAPAPTPPERPSAKRRDK